MNALAFVRQSVGRDALALLPPEMTSPAAVAMLIAIGWQESRFEKRLQMGGGPARGYWQFELGGVSAAMGPRANAAALNAAAAKLGYTTPLTRNFCYTAIAYQDVLACVCARLLLWNVPAPLPTREQPNEGWSQYIAAWNPGRPKPATWPFAWDIGWASIPPQN
ncbi:MAG: hypothetical protein ABI634_02645 [Acidobacteriota bacterium]